MADNIRITVDLAGFGEFSAAAQAAAAQAKDEAAAAIVADAQQRAPVKTGNMRDSTVWESTGPLAAEVRAEADYSLFVDEGTVTQPAQPWFTPAVEAERRRFPERVAAALAEVPRG